MSIESSPFALMAQQDQQLQILLRRAELAALIERHALHEGFQASAVPRLSLIRFSHADHLVHAVCEPALCLLAQGSQRVLLGSEESVYDPDSYLVIARHLRVAGQVVNASAELPHLGLRLELDMDALALLMCRIDTVHAGTSSAVSRGLYSAELEPALLDAMLRLVRLLDAPDDIATIAPLTTQEILYRLLTGKRGHQLARMALDDGPTARVSRAIHWLRVHYREPLQLQILADLAHMSVSTLRIHFKASTLLSPMQYQKQLRLQEARALLFAGQLDAASAGHRVGYDSATQFIRDYSRMFGAPPARDVRRFREQAAQASRGAGQR
ncbi:AraC family transcriptional regulator [Paucibacter sp. O1-1]|nr:AraC family transcriptional regulator [Paucibacter sp. O1-1]MDA3825702.1 AraC family transcriptional regulator [Paucibacter sp. O1-1]